MLKKVHSTHSIIQLIELCDSLSVRTVVWKGSTKLDKVFLGQEDLDLLVDNVAAFSQAAASLGFFETSKPWFKQDVGLSDFVKFELDGTFLHRYVLRMFYIFYIYMYIV